MGLVKLWEGREDGGMAAVVRTKRIKRLPKDTWERIRLRAEEGAPLNAMAAEYGIPYTTIRKRSLLDQWQTPARLARRENHNGTKANQRGGARNASKLQQAESALNADNLQQAPEAINASNLQQADSPPLDPEKLLASLESGDNAEALAALAVIAKGQLRLAISESAPGRDVATWLDILRKAAGLDGRSGGAASNSLRVPRSIGRPTIKRAEPPAANPPNPPAGFDLGPEPDPPGFIL